MPTNKLWLEHTEKAAWESVQALREKLADAEKRLQRLAPPTGGWQPLLDAIDAAKIELGLSSDHYAELLGELVTETRRARDERRALEQELNDLRSQSLMREIASAPVAAPRPVFDSIDDDDDDDLTPPRPRTVRARDQADGHDVLVSSFLQRYEATRLEASRNLDELFEVIDSKVADLADLDERALPDAAIEVAALLLRAAKSARRSLE